MVTVKVSELQGAALDWAVAQVEGVKTIMLSPRKGHPKKAFALFGSLALSIGGEDETSYAPSTCWHCGGPLIGLHAIGFCGHSLELWRAFSSPADKVFNGYGETHLIAACRLIVLAKLGDEIEVPDELIAPQP